MTKLVKAAPKRLPERVKAGLIDMREQGVHLQERWEHADDWPVPDGRRWRLHLSVDDSGAGRLTPRPSTSGSSWWAAIPPGVEHPGAFDHHLVRYRTEPLDADAHLVGPAHLTLRLASTAMDTHVQARLSDLAPDGTASVISVGWLLASHRRVDEDRSTATEIVHDHTAAEPLVPGEPVTLTFSLAPFAQLVRAGHRLRLEIGSDPERLAPPSDEFVYFGMAGPPYTAKNTVLHDGASTLDLTVRGTSPR